MNSQRMKKAHMNYDMMVVALLAVIKNCNLISSRTSLSVDPIENGSVIL